MVGAAHVLIDLGGVTFCDAGGIRLLLRLRQEVLAARGTLAVCDVSASVARVLEVMNIGGLDIPPPS